MPGADDGGSCVGREGVPVVAGQLYKNKVRD